MGKICLGTEGRKKSVLAEVAGIQPDKKNKTQMNRARYPVFADKIARNIFCLSPEKSQNNEDNLWFLLKIAPITCHTRGSPVTNVTHSV